MSSDPQRVQAIFGEVVKKPASERAEFLDRECAGDSELRRRVEALIQAHEHSGSFLDSPPKDLAGTSPTVVQSAPEQAGSLIGPYKLLQQIGEGGMGSVFMAEQIEPVERRVALKIIKPGMDTKAVIARFEAERQALAMMDHPNIAKVLDVGTTNSGRPYFVMELVRGVPITQYCDEHQLTPRQRLELFLPVCQAVQHAHQKGIIHRDIKPSNVLVAEYDDRPVPKIIDFGLAKAMEKRLTTKTMFTEFGQIVGTPDYMSPEQAKLNQMDIDTRSDIYSLGVLLYELLSGNTPFDRQRMRSAAFDELLRIIREEEPPKPSQRLSTVDTLPSIAASRHITPAELTRQLSGELDWIVMKALEKDRTRRYETANGLASDLRRYLNDDPVLACPPSTAYRFSKFARRNKAPIAIATFATAALIVLAIGSLFAAHRFRSLAQQNANLAVEKTEALTAETDAKQAARKAQTEAQQQRDFAENQRGIAESQRILADVRELRARRNLYAAHMNLAYDAWQDTDIPRTVEFLERHVPLPGEPDWRSFEWYYLAGLCNRDVLTIPVGQSMLRPAFSPDGRILAVSKNSRQIELWDLNRRERIKIFDDPTVQGPLAFSPDGTVLASAGNGELRLRDANTGELIRSMPGHVHHMKAIAFTPDGSKVITTDGGNLDSKIIPGIIRVWDVATGERLLELRGHNKLIREISVSPDGSTLVSIGHEVVRFWDLSTGAPIEAGSIRGTQAAAWSPIGGNLATYHGSSIAIWDRDTSQLASSFNVPASVHSLAYSPDGLRVATAHGDSRVRLWDVASGKELAAFKGHSQWVFYVTFSPDGKHLASVGRDMRVKVWSVEKEQRLATISGSIGRSYRDAGRDRVALSPDGNSLAGLRDDGRTVVLVDVASGRLQASLEIGSRVHAIAYSPDGQRLAVAHGAGLQLWNVSTNRIVKELNSDTQYWTVAFAPNGKSLAVGTDAKRIDVYDSDSLAKRATLPWQYATHLRKVAYSPDGKSLAAGTTGVSDEEAVVHLWDIDRRRLRFSLSLNSRSLTDLAFSPDGKTLAVSEGSLFLPQNGAATNLFDTTTGENLATLRGGAAAHMAVAFSNRQNTLLTADENGGITVWDLSTFEERMTFKHESQASDVNSWRASDVESLIIAPDGRTLISSDYRARIRLWHSATAERVTQIEQAGIRRRVQEYAKDRRWQEAADLCSAYLLQRGKNPTVRWTRATSFAELGRWDDALEDFEKLLEIQKTNYRCWYEVAVAQLANGDHAAYCATSAAMLEQFRETKDLTTAEFVCWTLCLAPRSKVEEDVDWVELLALVAGLFYDGEPDASAQRTLGAVLLRAGLHEESISALMKVEDFVSQNYARTSPDYSRYLLAIAHAELGDHEKSRDCLAEIESKSLEQQNADGDKIHWFRRATLAAFRRESTNVLDRAAESNSGLTTSDSTARLNRAMSIYSRAIQRQPDVPMLYHLRADVHQRLMHIKDATADLALADQLEQEYPLRRLNTRLAGVATHRLNAFRMERIRLYLYTMKDYDKAIEDCYALLRNSNDYSKEVLEVLFKAHELRGTLHDAEEDWTRDFSETIPDEFYETLIRINKDAMQPEEIVDVVTELIRRYPDKPHLFRTRGEAHFAVKQYQQAISDYNEAIRLKPNDFMLLKRRGTAYQAMGEYETAFADYDEAIGIAPDQHHLFAARAEAHLRLEHYEQAIADYSEAIRLDPTVAWVHQNRAKTYLYWGDYDQAIVGLDEAIRLGPPDHWAYFFRAEAHLKLKHDDQAIADYRRVVEIKPSDRAAWVKLLDIEQSRNASAETITTLVENIEAVAGGSGYLCHAAWHLLSQRRSEYERICQEVATTFADSENPWELHKVARAAALSSEPVLDTRQIVAMARPDPSSMSTPWHQHIFGLCLLRDGQPDAAIESFTLSLESTWTGAPSNLPALAIAHSAAGQHEQAEEWLRKSQAWAEQDPLDVRSELEPIARMTFQLLLREAQQRIDQSASH